MKGSPLSNTISKGTIKRRIGELMTINKKEDVSYEGKLKRRILRFKDSEKVGGIPNDIFPLVITTTIANLDVLRILIYEGARAISCTPNSFKMYG